MEVVVGGATVIGMSQFNNIDGRFIKATVNANWRS